MLFKIKPIIKKFTMFNKIYKKFRIFSKIFNKIYSKIINKIYRIIYIKNHLKILILKIKLKK